MNRAEQKIVISAALRRMVNEGTTVEELQKSQPHLNVAALVVQRNAFLEFTAEMKAEYSKVMRNIEIRLLPGEDEPTEVLRTREYFHGPYTHSTVSAHHQEIRDLMDQGLNKTQIAKKLGISLPTVTRRLKRAEEVNGSFSVEKIETAMKNAEIARRGAGSVDEAFQAQTKDVEVEWSEMVWAELGRLSQ